MSGDVLGAGKPVIGRMKINFKTCTEEELWQFVAAHLKSKGVDTVLVGVSFENFKSLLE